LYFVKNDDILAKYVQMSTNMANINISKLLTDDAILSELGARLTRHRIWLQMTQAELANQAGISKRTVERFESGNSTQMSTLIRIFRVLDLMENLDRLIPESSPKPMDLLKQKRKTRVRASKARRKKTNKKSWTWKEDK